jgi:hypothetical protein
MFHRPLLDLVAHSAGDELLEDVPGRLNKFSAGGRAFNSIFLAVRAGDAHPRLRDFFGALLDRDAPLSQGPTRSESRMRDILPERPECGFLDDVGRFLSKEDEGGRVRLSRRFIRVDIRGGQVTLTRHGLLDWDRPDDQDVLRHIAYGPSMEAKVPAYEVEVTPIVNLMLIYLRSEEFKGRSKTAPGAEEEEIFRRVVKFVRRQNGLRDPRALDPLKPYLSFLRWPQWRDAITRVRHSILRGKVKGPLE